MIQHQCVCGELYYASSYWQHADCKPPKEEPEPIIVLAKKAPIEHKKRGRPAKKR